MIEAADDLEQRGLAGSVGPDDADQLARRDIERDLAVGDDAAEPLGDTRNCQHVHPNAGRRRHQRPSTGTRPWGAKRMMRIKATP
jgi:hypothetical protein